MLTDAKRMLQIVNERGLKVNKARLNTCMMPASSLDPLPETIAVLSNSRKQIFLVPVGTVL